MDVFKSFHDFLRLLYAVFLEPLFSILAWFIDRGYLVEQWIRARITNQASAHRKERVKSSDLKCGRFLGEGCSGFVYEATWSRGRTLSLLARKAFPAVPADVFEYEAARLVELDHANIVKVLGWTVDRRSCSLVMDFMKYDLLSVVEKRKEAMRDGAQAKIKFSAVPIPFREAVHIMLEIAEGMKYVHEQGLAHDDLKPNNVLVDSESVLTSVRVRVTDFGLTETKKRCTTLVSHRARCLQILKWKAPELFEDLLGSSFEDTEDLWTELFPDLEAVKKSHASSSAAMGRAESKIQLADVYSFALTCSYVLGAQVPQDSHLGLLALRNGISAGARPHLPFECPKVLAALISKCWDPIPSRRPAFIDICKEMRTVKWELKQIGDLVQEFLDSEPQGSGKGVRHFILTFAEGKKKASLILSRSKHKRFKTAAVENMRGPAFGTPILHASAQILDHVPRVRSGVWTRELSFDIGESNGRWTEVTPLSSTQDQREGFEDPREEFKERREEFGKLKAHPKWGHFFFDFNESGLKIKGKIGEGSQALMHEGEWKRNDDHFYAVAIKTFKRHDFTITNSMLHFFNSKGSDTEFGTSRVLRPLGGTLLNNGRLALVYERCWGDLRKLIDLQLLKNTEAEMPPFNQELEQHIMLQIAEGLEELHEFGICHRDVKSMNVVVRDLVNFTERGSEGLISCALIDYDDSEKVLGTGFWRAPEILNGLKTRIPISEMEFTEAMDVYSFGMTCYEILTGKIPFAFFSPRARDIVIDGVRPKLPDSVHPELRALVESCWHPDPSKRPISREIVFVLKRFLSLHDPTPSGTGLKSVREDQLLDVVPKC